MANKNDKKSNDTVIKEVDLKANKKEVTKKKNLSKVLITLAVISFSVYALVVLVNQQMQINQAKSELDKIYDEIELIEISTDELNKIANSDAEENEQYIEDLARNQYGYAKEGERIFINIAG